MPKREQGMDHSQKGDGPATEVGRYMASDDLARRKEALENSIDSLGGWLIGFTAVVVIGLFIELYHLIAHLSITHDWWELVDSVGTGVVAAGVSGELLIEFLARRKERKLRNVNADIDNDYQGKLTAANERIAELNLQSEQERLARVKIEERLAPRTLNSTQVATMIEKLTRFTGQAFEITTEFETQEERRFVYGHFHGSPGCRVDFPPSGTPQVPAQGTNKNGGPH